MTCSSVVRFLRLFGWGAAVCLVCLSQPILADDTGASISDFGYRPDSQNAPAFLEALPTATVAVYPTIIRRLERTAHSVDSREQIVSLLKEKSLAQAVAKNTRVDLGGLTRVSQWDLFQNDMHAIAERLQSQKSDADYSLVLEIVPQPGNQVIFGIHCYLLDQQRQNAFSFLLNSHHRSFVDANLIAEDSSEEARASMIERATRLGVSALQAQIEQAHYCATHTETSPIIPRPGVFDDFENGLPLGVDEFGVPVGFVTFDDGASTVRISATTAYPALPPKVGPNAVLRLDVNVTGWAGFAHTFQNDSLDQWIPYDWSAFDEIRFWFYGNNSGTSLFVDVIDNRKPCSKVDDAERYVYEFADDFSGWEVVTVRFADMVRKEVGNGAPNDGLGLSAVHGWAFGTLNTDGPQTFYIDDFGLRRSAQGNIDYPINELPMYGGRQKTADQERADKAYIKRMTSGGRNRAAAAESAARLGWNSYYNGDSAVAIRRFNQAWLLDSRNQLALWGFAVISAERGQIEEAVRFFRMAIENGPENPPLRRDYEFALKQLEK